MGSYEGVLRVYQPTNKQNKKDKSTTNNNNEENNNATNNNKGYIMLCELSLDEAILQTEVGRFIGLVSYLCEQ